MAQALEPGYSKEVVPMAGPIKSSGPKSDRDPNKNQNGSDNKRRGPWGFLNLVLWAVLLVVLLNTCRSTMQSARTQQVPQSTFDEWVELGYVNEVEYQSGNFYFTLKEDTPPIEEYRKKLESGYNGSVLERVLGDGGLGLAAQAGNSLQFVCAPIVLRNDLTQWLSENGVVYKTPVVTDEQYMLSAIVSYVLPVVVMVAALAFLYRYMFKKMGGSGGLGGIGGVGKANAKVYVEKKTGVSFRDVAGQDEAKESLEEIIDFLHNPGKYTEIGAKLPKGALLVGPPGTGKTLLAKAVAGEAGVPFFSISGSDFVEMFVGVGASRVRDLFKEASKMAPCIIFIDEIDTIGKSRDNRMGGNDEREQTLNQLLAELDGFDPGKGVIVLGATNRPEVLDKALLRPGRFDRRITIDRPNLAGRLSTLQVHTRKIKLAEDVDLNKIAQATAGCVGADLANLVNEAALRAVRQGRKAVNQQDLLTSFEFVIAGSEKKGTVLTEQEKRMIAYHEVGHALVAHHQKNNAMPVSKITIVPHTQGALGYTLHLPEEEKFLMTQEDLLSEIRTLLAGRSAEEVVFGSKSSGAANDIERATEIARKMVTMFGMSDKYGMMGLATVQNQYLDGQMGLTCAQDTAAGVDSEVRAIIDRCHSEAVDILQNNREMLDKIAAYLLKKETITGAEMLAIIEGRDPMLAEVTLGSDVERPARSIHMVNNPIPGLASETDQASESDPSKQPEDKPE